MPFGYLRCIWLPRTCQLATYSVNWLPTVSKWLPTVSVWLPGYILYLFVCVSVVYIMCAFPLSFEIAIHYAIVYAKVSLGPILYKQKVNQVVLTILQGVSHNDERFRNCKLGG